MKFLINSIGQRVLYCTSYYDCTGHLAVMALYLLLQYHLTVLYVLLYHSMGDPLLHPSWHPRTSKQHDERHTKNRTADDDSVSLIRQPSTPHQPILLRHFAHILTREGILALKDRLISCNEDTTDVFPVLAGSHQAATVQGQVAHRRDLFSSNQGPVSHSRVTGIR